MTDEKSIGAPLQGVRLLVVEDDALVYMLVEEMLAELGCEVVPAAHANDAVALAASETLDGALLDINLWGEASYSVADEFVERGIPFAFVTGYDRMAVREAYRDRPLLQKPMRQSDLLQVVSGMLRQSAKRAVGERTRTDAILAIGGRQLPHGASFGSLHARSQPSMKCPKGTSD